MGSMAGMIKITFILERVGVKIPSFLTGLTPKMNGGFTFISSEFKSF